MCECVCECIYMHLYVYLSNKKIIISLTLLYIDPSMFLQAVLLEN